MNERVMGTGKEVSTDEIETGVDNGWKELEELGAKGFTPKDTDSSNEVVANDDRQDKILLAAEDVKAAYRKDDTEQVPIAIDASDRQLPSEKKSRLANKKGFLSSYDAAERRRINEIKSGLGWHNIDEYERRQINSRPSVLTKTIRSIGDRMGIKTKRGEKRRDGEAMHVALAEYYEEKAAKEKAIQEEMRASAIREEKQRAEREAHNARVEKEYLTRDMTQARKVLDYNKQDRFEKQRIQEIVERDLNSNLLSIDNLEVEVVSENPGIQKRSISFGNADIPVYDLRGIPFAILSTTIDYRSGNKSGEIGTETFKRVMEDPAVWAERRDKAERAGGFGTRNDDARGDTISTSYWNSERNIGSHVVGDLIYGFENVRADSIISVSNGDGGTSNMGGRSETTLYDTGAIKMLEGAGGTSSYNEVLLRRYTENGMPKKPDYIVVENGKITEAALRHAKYFGVPIVNVERSIYEKNSERKGDEILASISENDSYEEMDSKLAELLSMTKYKYLLPTLEGIGRNYDIPRPLWSFTDMQKKGFEIAKMEQLKRLDFIKKTLEEAARNIDFATEKGALIGRQEIPGFEYFSVSINDIQNNMRRHEFDDVKGANRVASGNCSSIDVEFRLKNSSRYVETHIYDGEKIYEVDKALARGSIREEDIKNADSSFYNALEPVVLKYFEAYRRNQELAQKNN